MTTNSRRYAKLAFMGPLMLTLAASACIVEEGESPYEDEQIGQEDSQLKRWGTQFEGEVCCVDGDGDFDPIVGRKDANNNCVGDNGGASCDYYNCDCLVPLPFNRPGSGSFEGSAGFGQ